MTYTYTMMQELAPAFAQTVEQVVWNEIYARHGLMAVLNPACHAEAKLLAIAVRDEWDRREAAYCKECAMATFARFN